MRRSFGSFPLLRAYRRSLTSTTRMTVAQAAPSGSATQTRSSTSSLPDSPSQIPYPTSSSSSSSSSIAGAHPNWVPSDIPKTWKDSFQAWIKKTEAAAAELHLYKRTGYFDGATLNNAPNEDLDKALRSASSSFTSLVSSKAGEVEQRATVGTSVNPLDGKVGSIRLVDIGPSSSSSSALTASGVGSWLFQRSSPRLVNMVEIGTPRTRQEIQADHDEEKVVLLHGYGAGTAFFFQNLASLAAHPQSRLYALDWLGMGRSARVPFHIPHAAQKTMESRVETTENFFVGALEDWRKTMGVEKMTLVGHSLGGYLSLAYTLRYPQRVNRLILVSPAGIGENPNEKAEDTFRSKGNGTVEANKSLPAAAAAAEEAEINQAQQDHVPASERQAERDAKTMQRRASEAGSNGKNKGSTQKTPDPPRWGSKTRAVVSWLWEQNFSPFGIVRGSLFLGPMMTGRYTSRRFGALPDEDLKALHAYCHGIFSARGSSEYALAHLLAPGAFARWPMVRRIEPIAVPTSFIYGEYDWMDVKGGEACVEKLAKRGNRAANTFVVPHSGHHVYLDNPKAFDGLVAKLLRGEADGNSNVSVPSGI